MNTKLNHVHDWLALAQEADCSVAQLAKLCGVSVRTLERQLAKTKHQTPKSWLSEQRQNQAIELLRFGCSVKETAVRLGYKYATNFTRKFKNRWGHCPTAITSPIKLRKMGNVANRVLKNSFSSQKSCENRNKIEGQFSRTWLF